MIVSQWDEALKMAEHGLSVIPINHKSDEESQKKPLVEWRSFQSEGANENQIEFWSKVFPQANVGIVTGAISGFVVVDCDTPEAISYCRECGIWSPVRVRTKRGVHLIFRHPLGGRRFGPRVGSNSTGIDWPKFPGLDFKGDGAYVISYAAPYYQLDCDEGFDLFDLEDVPEWTGWPMDRGPRDLDELDLTTANIIGDISEWDRTAEFVAEHFPSGKIPTGKSNGRNSRVARVAGEAVASGLYGDELVARVEAYMDAFFVDRLHPSEYRATCRSVEEAERRNHPERVAKHEERIKAPPKSTEPATVSPLLFLRDAEKIAADVAATPMLIEPFMPRQSIVHVSGYTGHGKSLFVSHMMAAATAGRPTFGAFEISTPIRCLYLDYENGRLTLAKRLRSMLNSYGDPGERFAIWTRWIENDDLPLFDNESLKKLSVHIKNITPDVLVIDTARTAFPGLEENDAKAWAPINGLLSRIQNYGISTILVHHKNKPQNGGMSREAGSTAQLNLVETQFYVTQVYQDRGRADATAAICDEDYPEPVWPRMVEKAERELGPDWIVVAVYEVTYGKVRDWSDLHTKQQWMALCTNIHTGHDIMIGSASVKQKAITMYRMGTSAIEIAKTFGVSVVTVRSWVAPPL